ncbi:Attacin-A [Eumeta japonica]|uniref:Attacin-A n=1 Tax=Eumeta variegata TaxID=151549 RepID=A0A4C1TS28_EUMVA|nr:Attacin-A [Eumeta japonica]
MVIDGTANPTYERNFVLVNRPVAESVSKLIALEHPGYREILGGTAYPIYNENFILVNRPDKESLIDLIAPEYRARNSVHRTRRQVHGAISTNTDGSVNIHAQLPLASDGTNVLSAVSGVDSFLKDKDMHSSVSSGLALDNESGHGLSVINKHTDDFGDQLTAAGHFNLLNSERHNLNANAFVTRTMPENPTLPNFNTIGGGLDYMYKNKIGASLSASHTDLFKQTDLSAMGKLNLFKSPSMSMDFSAGATKSMSPFIPKSFWQPNRRGHVDADLTPDLSFNFISCPVSNFDSANGRNTDLDKDVTNS